MGKTVRRPFYVVLAILFISVLSFVGGVYYISNDINPYATIPLDYKPVMGGYAQQGGRGNGDIEGDPYANGVDWIVSDNLITLPSGKKRVVKICRREGLPTLSEDVDFFRHDGTWYKLRSGAVRFAGGGFTITPATQPCCGGWPTPNFFKAKAPFFLYRLKVVQDKLFRKRMSPYEYLLYLKANEESCRGLQF